MKTAFWTAEKCAELIRRCRAGETFKSIGDDMGRTPLAVREQGYKLGLSWPKQTFWTDERIELLRERWEEGIAARQIAAEIGHSCTKSMVIGKANRLHLPMHEAVAQPLARRQKIEFIEEMFKPHVPTCQYPIGHPGEEDFHFCGDKPRLDSSYCEEHHALCYQAGSSWLERQSNKDRYGKPPRHNWGPIQSSLVG